MSTLELVPVQWLKPHEQIKSKRVGKLRDKVMSHGYMHKPLLVDEVTGTILDGHHRHRAALEQGLTRIPCLLFDYLADERVEVEAWPGGEVTSLTKQDVVDRALQGRLYTPKTSRHRLPFEVPRLRIPLEVLRDGTAREPVHAAWIDDE